jgi:hypothetical protein
VTGRILLSIAVAGNCAVTAITFAVYGWNVHGAHNAARNTARFSVLWFLMAFAAPGLARFIRVLPAQATLTQSFVAAHIVHFATVAILLAIFESAHLSSDPLRAAIVVLIGFSAVVGLGLTATPRTSRFYTAVHKVILYAIFLIFFLVFVHHPVKPLRLLAVALGLALLLRISSGMTFFSARTETAD